MNKSIKLRTDNEIIKLKVKKSSTNHPQKEQKAYFIQLIADPTRNTNNYKTIKLK